MTTIFPDEAACWELFKKADRFVRCGGVDDALDILYHLEIQELSPALRILVNTNLTLFDNAPELWKKMEWIGEARFVMRGWKDTTGVDDSHKALHFLLEEKMRAAEMVVIKLPDYLNEMDVEEEYDEEDEEDEEVEEDEGDFLSAPGSLELGSDDEGDEEDEEELEEEKGQDIKAESEM